MGSKANYPPYGIDFPKGYTGRFTNGRTSTDIIGMALFGLQSCTLNDTSQFLEIDDFIPPYATATIKQFSKGVNYASGGAGIREESGHHNFVQVNLCSVCCPFVLVFLSGELVKFAYQFRFFPSGELSFCQFHFSKRN
ncbi:hypothetical protein L1987_56798 [Smallanthus sonchifolius]|uniref:Uncharacterized protein n=1 Tax=Smallanthus sonchifolius TaxID=185202 RepID=A0ACB9DBH3_9ASTR|nr:hypothetical protein L1987_56798 [Smallanthus sonchifolius]